MIPADAKKRWCPFVRELGDNGAAYNRNYSGQRVGGCLGPDCMAWRYHDVPRRLYGLTLEEPELGEIKTALVRYEKAQPDDDGSELWNLTVGAEGGFCGLAGSVGAP